MPKSLLDYAYEFVSAQKNPISFKEIWKNVSASAGLNDEEAANKVSRFYTNLTLDGRFVNLGDNTWDLRVRHTFDKVHIDMKDVYSDVESESVDDDNEEINEEKEYNETFEDNEKDEFSDEAEGTDEENL